MENCLHLRRGQIYLRERPWHSKLRLNVRDHLVSGYIAGQLLESPCSTCCFTEAAALPMHAPYARQMSFGIALGHD